MNRRWGHPGFNKVVGTVARHALRLPTSYLLSDYLPFPSALGLALAAGFGLGVQKAGEAAA